MKHIRLGIMVLVIMIAIVAFDMSDEVTAQIDSDVIALQADSAIESEMMASYGTTNRVSVGPNSAEGDGQSLNPSISADGRYIAFQSNSSNLVDEPIEKCKDEDEEEYNCWHIYVRDRKEGKTTLVSGALDDTDGLPGDSEYPSISPDGRYVAFHSDASNLVEDDNNGVSDVFVFDRETGETIRVSVPSIPGEKEGNSASYYASISKDGLYIAFVSYASNLVDEDTNGAHDIFVHDRTKKVTTRVSVATDGPQANGDSYDPSISADGRRVAFISNASNLVPGDTQICQDDSGTFNCWDVFVHDITTKKTTRESVDSNDNQANNLSLEPAISADGTRVVFVSYADNLMPGDTNNQGDIYIRNRQNRVTSRVSVAPDGSQANGLSYYPAITADGRFVSFGSEASNLVADDDNDEWDIFVHDRKTGITRRRVSVNNEGEAGNGGSYSTSISATDDGNVSVAFDSLASNLVKNDTNETWDIFVHLWNIKPTITGFIPPFGAPKTVVTIKGTNFFGAKHSDETGVMFYDDIEAGSFDVISDTEIKAIVPEGVTTGPIVVKTPDGTATSAMEFKVVEPIFVFLPSIYSP